MPAFKPEDILDLLSDALNAGDAETIISLFEEGAVLEGQPGQALNGRDAIYESLVEFLARKPGFKLLSRKVIQAGDIALLYSAWLISESDTEFEVKPALVVRRQDDGSWKVVIDNPSGGV